MVFIRIFVRSITYLPKIKPQDSAKKARFFDETGLLQSRQAETLLFNFARADYTVNRLDGFHTFIGDIAVDIEDGVCVVFFGAVDHHLDIDSCFGDNGADLREHVWDIPMEHADTDVFCLRQLDFRKVHGIDYAACFKIINQFMSRHHGAVFLTFRSGRAEVGD